MDENIKVKETTDVAEMMSQITSDLHMKIQIKTEPAVRKRSTSTNVDTGSDYSDDLTTCLPDTEEGPLDCSLGYDQVLQDSQISSGKRGSRLSRKPFKHKTCLVCGDKALGYNFNAISCESCKAFFRRNAFRTIRGRCEGKCEVTVESRSYCKKCRLAKCFSVGMKKELILNDKQKMHRKRKIEANRLRKNGLPVPSPSEPEVEEEEEEEPSKPSVSTEQRESPTVETPAMTHAFASEVQETDLTGLMEDSRRQIDEVLSAFRVSFDAPIDKTVYDNPSGSQFLDMADMSVRRLVKMAKHLKVFQALDQEDQISLLKGSVLEVLILRSVKLFDIRRQTWHVKRSGQDHQIKSTSLESEHSSSVFFDQYKRFVMGTIRATRCDNTVLMFLMVMSVFSSDRPNVKEQYKIMDAQEMFATVLEDYLKHKYPSQPLMFAKTLQRLADIRELQENHARMMLHMNVDELQPLIVEIFDLSSRSGADEDS